jgi:threonine dehydrogenase-like Zn-dependent dehydrogenase
MKAFFIEQPGITAIKEVSDPMPGPGEVLLRTQYVGLCGSDLNSFRGRSPMVSFPRIPGHEVAAKIEACGSEVPNSITEGQHVTVVPYTACRRCPACRRNRPNACEWNQTLGVQRDGALAERICVAWEKVVHGDGLSWRELSLVEPLSVGAHAIALARPQPSETAVVFGCGAVGLGAISACARTGARTIAVDIDDVKLHIAAQAGAALLINSATDDLHQRLSDFTDAAGPDVAVEAIGLPSTFRAAVDEVAFTGRVVYIGYAKEPVLYETRLFVQKELDIMGSRNATARDFEAVIAMLREGRFPVDAAVTMVADFESAGAALQEWGRNPAAFTKILIRIV